MSTTVKKAKARAITPIVEVKAGETWRFTARGVWVDWFVPCRADGYRNPLADAAKLRPEIPNEPWFKLIGRIGEAGRPYPVGRQADIPFDRCGVFEAFANDLKAMRWNNWGYVIVTAERLTEAPATPCKGADVASGGSASR